MLDDPCNKEREMYENAQNEWVRAPKPIVSTMSVDEASLETIRTTEQVELDEKAREIRKLQSERSRKLSGN